MATPEAKPWAERRAWRVTPEFSVKGARLLAVYPVAAKGKRPVRPESRIIGRMAALTFAREQGIEKLGPPKAGRLYHPVHDHGFAVRWTASEIFIVEGPPDHPSGRLPEWGDLCGREQRPVEGVPGLFELVAPGVPDA